MLGDAISTERLKSGAGSTRVEIAAPEARRDSRPTKSGGRVRVEYPIATSCRSFTLVERATPRLLLGNLGTSVPTQVRVVSGCSPFCWSSRVFGLGPVGQRGA